MSAPLRRVSFSGLSASKAGFGKLGDGLGVLDTTSPYPSRRIGEILVSMGVLAPDDLRQALARQANDSAPPIGAILLAEGLVNESALAAGLALQRGIRHVPVTGAQLDLSLVDRLGADRCLSLGLVPWRQVRGRVIVATSRPERFAAARTELESAFGQVGMAIAEASAVHRSIVERRASWLVNRAEARPPHRLSVRNWRHRDMALILALLPVLLITAFALAPVPVLTAFLLIASMALAAMSGLKLAALIAARGPVPPLPAHPTPDTLPTISVLVPLLSEAEITDSLVKHLTAIDYPADHLDVLLVTEADDACTAAALGREDLPPHFTRVTVPEGRIRTKPRALNYALDFAEGDIIGVWDAEDAPETDQLRIVAATFATAPPDVVCLQGRLDFYNPHQNWLSRCFTLDYAGWFRVILPGLARMGFAIPLGGTTLFFRRSALEELGRWDAHNVTEDADLGVRLARAGWRTDMVATTTYEEANCRPIPWVRQRTRWLKGYALTWAVHMQQPLRLWRELGARRFFGFQLMFLGTMALFLSAPLLWSLWALPLGLPHPVAEALPAPLLNALIILFIGSELISLTVALVAAADREHRWLIKWAPTLPLYFALGALACYRAIVDIAAAPFYWDKTRHGISRDALIQHRSQRSESDATRRHARYEP